MDRLGDIGAEEPEGVARLRAEMVDPRPGHDRSETGIEDEGQQCQGDRPGHECERQHHRRRHHDGDESRRDRVGEEIFDGLDILVGERDQVAGAPPHQISRRQGVELAEQIDPHFRQQPIGDVVRQPGFEPVEEAGERRRQCEQDQQVPEGSAHLDRGDGESAENADPDECRDPRYPGCHDDREPPPPRLDDLHQGAERRTPADRSRGLGHRVRRRRRLDLDLVAVTDDARCRVGFNDIAIVLALCGLGAHQPAIGAVAADQLGMPAAFDDMALVEDEDAVGADDARQPVREDQGRASCRQAVDRLLDHRLVLRVHRGERFVENEDRRIPQQRPGDRQALALAARQQDPALADHRVVTLRQQRDELVRIGVARRRLDLVARGVGLAEPQILFDGAVEQVGVLVDDGDHPAERFGIERFDVVTADLDRAALRVEEAQQQPRNRRFAGAARPDDADLLAGGDGEGQPVMGGAAPAGIGEPDVLESDGREERPADRRLAGRLLGDQRFGGEQRIDAGSGRLPEHPLMQHRAQIAQRAEDLGSGHQHDQQCLDAHQAVRDPPDGEGQGRRSADRHPAIGDAAGHHAHRQDPQRTVAQAPALWRQADVHRRALTECLQGRQALDAVEKLRAERLQRALAPLAGAALALRESARRDQGHEREDQHHRRDRHVPEGDEDEDRQRRQHRDAELRDILAEKSLQLLDPVDDRQHYPAGALAGKPSRAQRRDLVVEPAAQILLHSGRGAVGDHRAMMIDEAAQDDRDGDPHRWSCYGEKPGAVEHT